MVVNNSATAGDFAFDALFLVWEPALLSVSLGESVWLMISDKTPGLGTLCHWRLLAWSSPTETSASPSAENTFSPSQLSCLIYQS